MCYSNKNINAYSPFRYKSNPGIFSHCSRLISWRLTHVLSGLIKNPVHPFSGRHSALQSSRVLSRPVYCFFDRIAPCPGLQWVSLCTSSHPSAESNVLRAQFISNFICYTKKFLMYIKDWI